MTTVDSNIETATAPKGLQLAISLQPAPQSRLTIFFRVLMLIPHLVALLIMGFVLIFLHLASFVAGLLFGRLPEGLQNIQVGILRYYANVTAYSWLLSSEFPKFDVEPREDTICDVTVSHEKLNRLAVLFRGLLAIPAIIFTGIIEIGNDTLVLAAWVTGLIKGEVPTGLHQALATNLRTHLRYNAYMLFLTPEQPWHHWRGDGGETPSLSGRTTNFILSAGAKTALTVSLIFGVVGFGVVGAEAASQVNSAMQTTLLKNAVDDSVVTATNSIIAFEGPNKTCKKVSCIAGAAKEQAAVFEETIATLKAKKFPASVQPELGAYIEVLKQVDAYFVIISTSKSIPGQQFTFEKMLMPVGLQIYPAGAAVTSAL
jgi:hypothetical protein